MSDSRVTIAVIATSYEHLTSTLDSLVTQTYDNTCITVLHSLTDLNIHGIIRNYPKIIYSIDIDDENAINKVKSFGRYFCIINSGDIVSRDWVKKAIDTLTKKRIAVLATLPVKLNGEGNITKKPQSLVNKYEMLVNAYIKRASIDAVLLIDTRHSDDYSTSSLDFSSMSIVGIRNKVPDNSKHLMRLYIDRIIYNKTEAILSNTTEEKKADTVALLINASLRKRNLRGAIKIFINAMRTSGYRKAIIKSIANKEKI